MCTDIVDIVLFFKCVWICADFNNHKNKYSPVLNKINKRTTEIYMISSLAALTATPTAG